MTTWTEEDIAHLKVKKQIRPLRAGVPGREADRSPAAAINEVRS
jgi:hypothetical protein